MGLMAWLHSDVKVLCGMQFGSYLVDPGTPSGHNLTGTSPAAGYTLFEFSDWFSDSGVDIYPVLGTCFNPSETLNDSQNKVDECANSMQGGDVGVCCYDFMANPLPAVSHATPLTTPM